MASPSSSRARGRARSGVRQIAAEGAAATAVKEDFQNCDENGQHCDPCTSLDRCTWDPRTRAAKTDYLTQSDKYNRWVLADKDRNISSYVLMLQWNTDVVNGEDDGYNGASYDEHKVRYLVDAFTYFDGQTLAAP